MGIKDGLKKKIYEKLNYGFIDNDIIRRVYYPESKEDSQNSYLISEIKQPNKPDYSDKKDLLIRIFKISCIEAFNRAYKMVINGSGQEANRISVMHSSSLCALLCFYKSSDSTPIAINGIKYNKVYFEVQNKVFDNPSNIDVVLVSEPDKAILFLESKFSEYLSHGKCVKISEKYTKQYDLLKLKDIGYSYKSKDGFIDMVRLEGKNDYYLTGIKQMISHYIGIKEFCAMKCSLNNDEVTLPTGYRVFLGEVLFNAWNYDNSFNSYEQAYFDLAKNMNSECNEFKVLDNVLTYQNIFQDFPLDKLVKEYYNL